jgi:hypothetical protein
MIETEGPFILDVRIEREENVFPMVPAGAAINEMIGGHVVPERELELAAAEEGDMKFIPGRKAA